MGFEAVTLRIPPVGYCLETSARLMCFISLHLFVYRAHEEATWKAKAQFAIVLTQSGETFEIMKPSEFKKKTAVAQSVQLLATGLTIERSEFTSRHGQDTDPEARVRFPGTTRKKSSGSGTGSTHPREYN
jgi:hypothetical protein